MHGEAELLARAVIAAALIQSSTIKLEPSQLVAGGAKTETPFKHLIEAVDIIYTALNQPH